MGPSTHVWFLDAKQRLLDRNNKSLWVPDITCRFVHGKQRDYHLNHYSLCVPALICGFCLQNSAFWSRNSVSMGPSPDLQLLHAKQRVLDQNYKSLWVPDLTCPFVHAKQLDLHQNIMSIWGPALICLAPELLVSMYRSPHLWFLYAKQRI